MVDFAHLVSQHDDHVEYELSCPVCKENITIKVHKEVAITASRFPFEYVDVHGNPPHGITLYIDKNWMVRGMEIFKNINVQSSNTSNPKMVRVPKVITKINPMARQLGIISNKEYQIIEQINGAISIEEIASNIGKDFDYVFDILQNLTKKKMVEIKKVER